MKYVFCFQNQFSAEAATVERKKIDRGIVVIAKWDNPDAPTITYEIRVGWDATVTYRVKYNTTVWAEFNEGQPELVWEFAQALHELGDVAMKRRVAEARDADADNSEAAYKFFRGDIHDVSGSLSAARDKRNEALPGWMDGPTGGRIEAEAILRREGKKS